MTDKAGAGVVKSSLVQRGQVLHQAGLGVFGHGGQSSLWCSSVRSPSHYEVFPHLNTTGTAGV